MNGKEFWGNDDNRTSYVVILGFMLALSLILSYVESLIPFPFGVPGMKLGLPNMAVVILIYRYGAKEGIVINVLRIILSGFLFGNLFGIMFSISGALISFLCMIIAKKSGLFDMRGVSVIGGLCHNIAQLIVAAFIVKTSGIMFYLPVLLVSGAVTGFLNGFIAEKLSIYLNKSFIRSKNR